MLTTLFITTFLITSFAAYSVSKYHPPTLFLIVMRPCQMSLTWAGYSYPITWSSTCAKLYSKPLIAKTGLRTSCSRYEHPSRIRDLRSFQNTLAASKTAARCFNNLFKTIKTYAERATLVRKCEGHYVAFRRSIACDPLFNVRRHIFVCSSTSVQIL